MTKQNKKGQVAVLDLFISALIFSIIVTTVMFTWNSYTQKIEDQLDYNSDLLTAYHISDLLTRYPGKPSSWEFLQHVSINPVEIIGLAQDDRVLNPMKVDRFLALEYEFIQEKLNIGAYDFYFHLTEIDGDEFNPILEVGNITDNSSAVVLKRYVIYNETESILEFWLQKK